MLQNIFLQNWLLMFPLNLFALPGLIYLFSGKKSPFIFLFMIATLLQIFLVNFKAYENRFYLFLIPIFGSGIGLCFKIIFKSISSRAVALLILCPLIIFGLNECAKKTYSSLHSQDKELSEAVPELRKWLTPDSKVIVRKPHIPFYTQSQELFFPHVNSLEELQLIIREHWKGEPIYLYYGPAEFQFRPQFSLLKYPEKSPEWLETVAQSSIPSFWVLYKYNPNL